MKEPDVEQQTKEAIEQYKDRLTTKEEYEKELDRISHNYDEWLKRNE